jgi:hypothetical protein
MTPQETTMALRFLQGAYPHVQVSEETIELWINLFASDDAAAVLNACRDWARDEGRWPTPADIRRLCRDAVRREMMEPPPVRQLTSPGSYPSFDEGIRIAYNAYCSEVRRVGKHEPKTLEAFTGMVGHLMPHYSTRGTRS